MKKIHVPGVLALVMAVAVSWAVPAGAHDTHDGSGPSGAGPAKHKNMDLEFISDDPFTSPGNTNPDLAFWGNLAIQGSYEGFRLIDISQPDNPVEILDYTGCVGGSTAGNQGDVIVWDDVLVRSWNSPAPAGATCDGEAVPQGFEGLHVFDLSNAADPDLVAAIDTDCGSHTATGVPDLEPRPVGHAIPIQAGYLNEEVGRRAEERANGIRACAIFPGDIDTPLLERRPNPPTPEARARMLQPADVADCALLAIHLPTRAVVEEILIRPP